MIQNNLSATAPLGRFERELCSCCGLRPVHGSRSDADEALKRFEQFAQTRDGRTRKQPDDDKAARQARTNAILKPVDPPSR